MGDYNNSSIETLVGAERIRKRPASMLGSSGVSGARHGVTEIVGNALDEHSSGFGDKLEIKYTKDNVISVRDYGRGVPIGWNEGKQNWNWHIVYNDLYGGGKYDNGQWYMLSVDNWHNYPLHENMTVSEKQELDRILSILDIRSLDEIPDNGTVVTRGDIDIKKEDNQLWTKVNNKSWSNLTWDYLNKRLNYLASVGLNGLGAASTQYTSEFFKVKSYTKGKVTSRSFERGYPIVNGKPFDMFRADLTLDEIKAIPEEIEDTDEPDGTYIEWRPDSTVFGESEIGGQWLYDIFKDMANVADIEIHFVDETTGRDLHFERTGLSGIYDTESKKFLRDNNDKVIFFNADAFTHGHIKVEGKDYVYVCRTDIVFAPTTEFEKDSCYHNFIKMKGGVQYDAVSVALLDFVRKHARSRGVKVDSGDIQGTFNFNVSTQSNYASFRNQTKDEVDDSFIYSIVYDTVTKKLVEEYAKGTKAIINTVDKIIEEAEIRATMKQQEKMIREAKRSTKRKEPDKFVSCRAYENKRYNEAELIIVEGDSAQGAVKLARNNETQAIYPIRGKGLNVLKKPLDRIIANKEIQEIFTIIGTGMDLNIKNTNTFNIDNLRFNKIIIMTDADEDGYQIRMLLFITFYKLAPELLLQGKVFVAETPRFKIDLSNGTTIYAKDDKERDEIIARGVGVKCIRRFKGLGEVSTDVLRETTVNPETRLLIPLSCDLQNETERELIDAIVGKDKYNQRKDIITAMYGAEVMEVVEENKKLMEIIENADIEDNTEILDVAV